MGFPSHGRCHRFKSCNAHHLSNHTVNQLNSALSIARKPAWNSRPFQLLSRQKIELTETIWILIIVRPSREAKVKSSGLDSSRQSFGFVMSNLDFLPRRSLFPEDVSTDNPEESGNSDDDAAQIHVPDRVKDQVEEIKEGCRQFSGC